MIYIGDHWYHIDVTWMDSSKNEYYRYFMMPDKVCLDTGHIYTDYYTSALSLRIAPVADSYDLYKYYHGSCDETLDYFKNIEIDSNQKYEVVFENNSEMELFLSHSGNVITDSNGKNYIISPVNIMGDIFLVVFLDI